MAIYLIKIAQVLLFNIAQSKLFISAVDVVDIFDHWRFVTWARAGAGWGQRPAPASPWPRSPMAANHRGRGHRGRHPAAGARCCRAHGQADDGARDQAV
jgi:hypothetical protein